MNSDICIPPGYKGSCEGVSGNYPFFCEASEEDLTGFVYQNQTSLVQAMTIVPVILGSLACLYAGAQTLQSEENRAKLRYAFENLVPQAEECKHAYMQRITPLALTILGIGASVVASEFVPSGLEEGVAAIGSALVLSAYLDGQDWIESIFSHQKNIKKLCQECFFSQDNSYLEVYRPMRNIGRILTGMGVAGVAGWWISELPHIINNSSTYEMALPGQTPEFVFLEYFLFAAAHLDQSFTYYINNIRNGQSSLLNGHTWFHLASAGMTAALPFLYMEGDLRIHHTLMGSAFMLLPFMSLKFLGAAFLADGLNYRFNNSGYSSFYCNEKGDHNSEIFNSFGLDNVAADNLLPLFSFIAVGCCLERIAESAKKSMQAVSIPPKISDSLTSDLLTSEV